MGRERVPVDRLQGHPRFAVPALDQELADRAGVHIVRVDPGDVLPRFHFEVGRFVGEEFC